MFFIDLDDLDRIILTHIDSDHIAGILSLTEDDLFIKNNLRKIISLFFNQYVDPSKVDYKQGILLKLYNEPIN